MKARTDFDIYIVGIGIKWVEHITLEVDRVLGRCSEILFVERAPGIEQYFLEKTSKVTDLTTLYGEDKPRENTYREMASKVISAALEGSPVAFAVYGHPTVYAYPPFLVREMARELGLSVKILPGVSALDCLFADLAVDPSVNGLQMYEATDLLLRKRSLDPRAASIIWQVGSIGTGLYSSRISKPERFWSFRDFLLNHYQPNHKVYSYFANPHPVLKSEIYEFSVQDLPNFAEILHAAVTLYIPPVDAADDFDLEVVRALQDPEHLRTLTLSRS